MGASDPRGGAIFDPRGMICRIYVKLHITMLHTKYRSFGFCVSEKKIFPCISYHKTVVDDDALGEGPV